jgi:hypothetical protein
MLSGILKSPIAIAANIAIMRAFVQVREALLAASTVTAELRELRAKVGTFSPWSGRNNGSGFIRIFAKSNRRWTKSDISERITRR